LGGATGKSNPSAETAVVSGAIGIDGKE